MEFFLKVVHTMAGKYETRVGENGEAQPRTVDHDQKAKVSIDRTASSDGDEERPQRAMSPGTLALMCDEKDPLFTAPPSPVGGMAAEEVSTSGSSHAAVLYAEQERAILSEYRDCLQGIIAMGKRRGSLLALVLYLTPRDLILATVSQSSLHPPPKNISYVCYVQKLGVRIKTNFQLRRF